MVPVYYVDRPATDGCDGEQVRIAVNGQTGRAAAVVFSEKRETHIVAPLASGLALSSESTVHAMPIEVKYVKSPFLYEIVRRGGARGVTSRGEDQARRPVWGDLREVGHRCQSETRVARYRGTDGKCVDDAPNETLLRISMAWRRRRGRASPPRLRQVLSCRRSAPAVAGAAASATYGIVVINRYERSLQDGVTE